MPTGTKHRITAAVRQQIQSWLEAKTQKKFWDGDEKLKNGAVAELVEKLGAEGENGHLWLELDEPIGGFWKIKRERRVQVIMDSDIAAAILEERDLLAAASTSYIEVTDTEAAIKALEKAGLLDKRNGFEVYTEVDAGKVEDLFFKGVISTDEHSRIFEEKISWATIPVK